MSTPPVLRVVEREMRVFARLWRGAVFSTFLSPVLFLAAMGLGLGGLVKEHTGSVQGLSYLDFVAPGLLAGSAMSIAANEAMWPVLGGVKYYLAGSEPIRLYVMGEGGVMVVRTSRISRTGG